MLHKLSISGSLLLTISVFFFFMCSYNSVLPTEGQTSPSGTIGIIYLDDGTRAAYALLRFIDAKSIPLPGTPILVDSIYTDSIGQYSLQSLADGLYNMFGEKEGRSLFRGAVKVSNGRTRQDTLSDTLTQPGSLCFFVRHRYHDDSRYILGPIPGSDRCLLSQESSGIFCLTNFPHGTYQVQFLSTLQYYLPVDTSMTIQVGKVDTLPDTLYLEYSHIPRVSGLSVSYDDHTNRVTLSWDKMDTLLVPGYRIYKAEAWQDFTLLTQSPVMDTFLTDSSLALWTTYKYRIAGYRDGKEGPLSENKAIETIFKPQGWYKGQLHCHTTNSDGLLPVSEVIRMYQLAGYDFVAVSDHNQVTKTEQYNDIDFVTIPNNELTFGIKHINAINATKHYTGPTPDPITLQDVIDMALSVGAIPHINHPLSAEHTAEDIFNATNVCLLEIINSRYEDPLLTTVLWDRVLSMGRNIYATGVDDAHNYMNEFNKGWIMVRTHNLLASDILSALEAGDFYASSGPVITNIATEGRILQVESVDGITIDFIGKSGTVLASVDSCAASYTLPLGELYVRAEVTNSHAMTAYTQAYFP